MRKEVAIFLVLILVVSAGAFAQSISENNVGKDVENYIKGIASNKGIENSQIKGIKKIDSNNLPKQIDIKHIDKNNVGIYEVNYTSQNDSRQLFVVTYSTDNLAAKSEPKNIQYFNFGISGNNSQSTYLETSAGVKTSEDVGYVMMRGGSITGISTSLEIYNGKGSVEIKVYKNGKDTGFSNLISSKDKKKIDYDAQSEGILEYVPGDVISVYVYQNEELNWGNVVTSVETTN
ncbi:MAG: hypothetical protein AABX03_03895 [Nanoarchaeota archaeon]